MIGCPHAHCVFNTQLGHRVSYFINSQGLSDSSPMTEQPKIFVRPWQQGCGPPLMFSNIPCLATSQSANTTGATTCLSFSQSFFSDQNVPMQTEELGKVACPKISFNPILAINVINRELQRHYSNIYIYYIIITQPNVQYVQ